MEELTGVPLAQHSKPLAQLLHSLPSEETDHESSNDVSSINNIYFVNTSFVSHSLVCVCVHVSLYF